MIIAVLCGLAVFATFGIGELIDRFSRRANRVELNVTHGHSRQHGIYLTTGIAAILFAIAFASSVFSQAEAQSDWPFFAAPLVFIFGLGAYSIRAWFVRRWKWDATGITYASGARVTRIAWADITHAKWVISGWCVTWPAGSVLCRNDVIGDKVITDALIRYRPDLAHITPLRA